MISTILSCICNSVVHQAKVPLLAKQEEENGIKTDKNQHQLKLYP
jgi:hypothetical protein